MFEDSLSPRDAAELLPLLLLLDDDVLVQLFVFLLGTVDAEVNFQVSQNRTPRCARGSTLQRGARLHAHGAPELDARRLQRWFRAQNGCGIN